MIQNSKKFITAVFTLLLAIALPIITPEKIGADESSHRMLAEEVMVLANTKQLMEASFQLLREKEMQQLEAVVYPGKSRGKDEELKRRVDAYLDQRLSWNIMRQGYADIFAEIFTEEELKAILDFYNSPAGRKFLSSGADLHMKLLKSTQEQLIGMYVEIEKIQQKFVLEQKVQKNGGEND